MSINVGFLNSSYSLDKFNTIDNRLIINSYNDCNIILLNHDSGSYPDALINYKDKYANGIKDDKYVIYDIESNIDIFAITSDLTEFGSVIKFNNDVIIKDLLNTKHDDIFINSNLTINLYTHSNFFQINSELNLHNPETSNNYHLLNVNSSFIDLQIGSNKINLNEQNIDINGDIYVRSNTIYANSIRNFGDLVTIYNPYLIGLQIESTIFYNFIHIQNDQPYNDNPTFQISRYYNNLNIVDISTCNLTTNIPPERNFSINRFGFVGIGAEDPIAPLSISKIQPTVIEYHGENFGDLFNVSKNADIGIGTLKPNRQLHIVRNDDLEQNNIRYQPLFGMDIFYEEASNIITSNFKETIFNVFEYDSNVLVSNIDFEGIVASNFLSNNIRFDFYTDETQILFLNGSIVNSNFVLQNNFTVFNTDMYETIIDVSNVIINNKEDFLTIANNTLAIDDYNNYILYNKIYYPYPFHGSEIIDDFSFTCNVDQFANTTIYHYTYSYFIATSNTSLIGYIADSNLENYNGSNFITLSLNKSIETVNANALISYDVNLYIEREPFIVEYIDTRPNLQPPPYFLYTTSNNTFIAALSSFGTFSLGKPSPVENTYLLYAPGHSRLDKTEINELLSATGSNISFTDCNLININIIENNSNISDFIYTNNAIINTLNVSNISIGSQDAVSISTSNINFVSLSSDYISVLTSNFHISTPFSVGPNINSRLLDNSTQVKVTIDNQISSTNDFYRHNKGIILTNEPNQSNIVVNPTISIIGYDDSIPYLNFNKSQTDYFMRVNSNLYNYNTREWSDVFELCCDTITGSQRTPFYNLTQPHLFQHIKKFNLITLGENNAICLDTLDRISISSNLHPITNSTNKITMGLPIGYLDLNATIYSDWPQYLHNNVINNSTNPYMLNIYGNVSISSIYNKPIIKARVDDGTQKNSSLENVNVAINGEPNIYNTLYVYGDGVFDNNLTTSNSLFAHGDSYMSKTLTVQDKIFAINGVMTVSDRTIKTDLVQIDNALDKLSSLTGYTYTRKDTGKREAGLVAQDVAEVLPEVITEENSLLTISYGNLSSIIVESIKELKEKINKIENYLGLDD